jgi:TonB family protein
MKKIFFTWYVVSIVLFSVGASTAQSESADVKTFDQDGLRFSYPAGWSLQDRSTAEVQYFLLSPKESMVMVAIISPRESVRDLEVFSRLEDNVKSTYFDTFEKGLTSPDVPMEKESVCLDLNGRKISGNRFTGRYKNEPAVSESYTLALGNRLLGLAYLSSKKDEAAASASWTMIRQSIYLNNTNRDRPELFLRNGGVLNGRALRLVRPSYPSGQRTRIAGFVRVLVIIDENGKVISAKPVSGNAIFYAEAVRAARQSTFPPTLICGEAIRVSGTITFNFVP